MPAHATRVDAVSDDTNIVATVRLLAANDNCIGVLVAEPLTPTSAKALGCKSAAGFGSVAMGKVSAPTQN